MQLLDLSLEIFKIVVGFTVRELGLKESMKARLTCRILADRILDAVIKNGVIEEVASRHVRRMRISYHYDVIARYLYHRVCTDDPVTHAWIMTIRETCRTLAQHTNSEKNTERVKLLQRSACLCLAVNAGSSVFEILNGNEKDDRKEFEGEVSANCFAIAAWLGDMTLVESFSQEMDPDPRSFFGRPSWAAAAQGHVHISQFLLNRGALPYNPKFSEGFDFQLSKSPLGVAAYMGHENITRLYLQPPHYCPEVRREEVTAIGYAGQGNQPATLTCLVEHYKSISTSLEYLDAIDGALVWSCRRGAAKSVRILLDLGADVNESDQGPRSCLQLAAVAGDTQVVKMLLIAGASLEPGSWIHRRTSTRSVQKRRRMSALAEARARDNHEITRLLNNASRAE
ncbi:hypothetical protein HYALB_00012695 [Hymenoscyphus albidus]|uniref:protein S-acyltransferase n=1 Tax=Hymenoscyphus albidus TaxID=595503 RepID=A0A9N9LTA3_9HELO|nr:hypothetical protein HYALB_00012695 [Hymenoscyphus albidus]